MSTYLIFTVANLARFLYPIASVTLSQRLGQ